MSVTKRIKKHFNLTIEERFSNYAPKVAIGLVSGFLLCRSFISFSEGYSNESSSVMKELYKTQIVLELKIEDIEDYQYIAASNHVDTIHPLTLDTSELSDTLSQMEAPIPTSAPIREYITNMNIGTVEDRYQNTLEFKSFVGESINDFGVGSSYGLGLVFGVIGAVAGAVSYFWSTDRKRDVKGIHNSVDQFLGYLDKRGKDPINSFLDKKLPDCENNIKDYDLLKVALQQRFERD